MSDRKFRYSYRLFIKEEGSRNAVEISHAQKDGEPTDLNEIEAIMNGAVSRALQAVCEPEPKPQEMPA